MTCDTRYVAKRLSAKTEDFLVRYTTADCYNVDERDFLSSYLQLVSVSAEPVNKNPAQEGIAKAVNILKVQ